MSNEQDLINRYESLLKSDNLKVLCGSKSDWKRSIEIKLLELKRIINNPQKTDNQTQKH